MTQKLYLETPYETQFEAEVVSVDENNIRLSQSLFYPTSGGQPGDIGTLNIANQNLEVATTRKDKEQDDVIHVLAEGCPLPAIGDKVTGEINWEARHKHMRMHTTMHLLCSLIEGDATGGQIGPEKSRLDFNVPTGAYDKIELTKQLNDLIQADHPVSTSWITDEELEANPQLIRTMSVKPPMGFGKVRVVQIGSETMLLIFSPVVAPMLNPPEKLAKSRFLRLRTKGNKIADLT